MMSNTYFLYSINTNREEEEPARKEACYQSVGALARTSTNRINLEICTSFPKNLEENTLGYLSTSHYPLKVMTTFPSRCVKSLSNIFESFFESVDRGHKVLELISNTQLHLDYLLFYISKVWFPLFDYVFIICHGKVKKKFFDKKWFWYHKSCGPDQNQYRWWMNVAFNTTKWSGSKAKWKLWYHWEVQKNYKNTRIF